MRNGYKGREIEQIEAGCGATVEWAGSGIPVLRGGRPFVDGLLTWRMDSYVY
jgi:hypothetical protein